MNKGMCTLWPGLPHSREAEERRRVKQGEGKIFVDMDGGKKKKRKKRK